LAAVRESVSPAKADAIENPAVRQRLHSNCYLAVKANLFCKRFFTNLLKPASQ